MPTETGYLLDTNIVIALIRNKQLGQFIDAKKIAVERRPASLRHLRGDRGRDVFDGNPPWLGPDEA